MYSVKISFFGRGNAPRGLKGFGTQESAEDYAYEVMERYEKDEIVGAASDRRVKMVEVLDETKLAVVTWYYTKEYRPGTWYHTGAWVRNYATT